MPLTELDEVMVPKGIENMVLLIREQLHNAGLLQPDKFPPGIELCLSVSPEVFKCVSKFLAERHIVSDEENPDIAFLGVTLVNDPKLVETKSELHFICNATQWSDSEFDTFTKPYHAVINI